MKISKHKKLKIQAKHIPDEPVLKFLSDLPPFQIAGWHDLIPRESYMPTVLDAMPVGTPKKVVLAKMKSLKKRGLIDGCICGCRGDFTIKHKLLRDYAASRTAQDCPPDEARTP